MDRKKELKQQYKDSPIDGGIYQVKNTINQKIMIVSTQDFKTMNGLKFMLNTNSYMPNKLLQQEWNEYGMDAFTINILERLDKEDRPFFTVKEELAKLEEKWLEKLQPYGDKGYHK
ncbi:GIY-YIG nuclease family protein [Gracilibacillus caseinilyticus]|uniref:GIY-YIG nuclease family protein n=1 Tax=Gracilibacillus caseinilyticus TaxID=2932256 RepID=A0ABY4F629_9BACI|nr:GIY-YIG nuclease family protein [Gracilibacillus caseinilyticus]UOQ49901.1 GIY-YIG nuclease family protein [Gracilibacillus caseinilyticus]